MHYEPSLLSLFFVKWHMMFVLHFLSRNHQSTALYSTVPHPPSYDNLTYRCPLCTSPSNRSMKERFKGYLGGKDEEDDEVGDSCGGRFYQLLSQQSRLLPSLAAVFSFPS